MYLIQEQSNLNKRNVANSSQVKLSQTIFLSYEFMLERHLSDLRKAVPQFTAFIKDHLHKITVFPDKSKLEMCQNQLETLEI